MNNELLESLMKQAGVASFRELAKNAGVSQWQIKQLRGGKIGQMRVENLQKIAKALQVPVGEFLTMFEIGEPVKSIGVGEWETEYKRLQEELGQQKNILLQDFREETLQKIESWLLQWPTAAYAVQQKPDIPATRLLPLVRPVEQLVQEWGVEMIGPVGAEVEYDPHRHQLMEGSAEAGQRVKVRYPGYRQGEKLLYRAKVSVV